MRVAVIVLGLVVVSTPSQASWSCMTRAEARQQFPTSHLYWYGSDHCWRAMTLSRRRVVHHVRENVQREAQRCPAESYNPEPQWREAKSEMLTANEPPSPRQMEPAQKSAPDATFDDLWQYRVDAMRDMFLRLPAQPDRLNAAHGVELTFTPMRVLLAYLALVLTLALIEARAKRLRIAV